MTEPEATTTEPEDEPRADRDADAQAAPAAEPEAAPAAGEEAPESSSAPPPRSEEDRARLKLVIEALLFSVDRPVSASRLAEASDARDGREVRSVVLELRDDYDRMGRAFGVEEIAGGYQILSRPEYAPYIVRLQSRQSQDSLSNAALEVLAIVAYRQPITRAALEDIRGVGCGHLVRQLVDRRLLKVTGRSEELGRPMLYGTTRQFLEAFGLRSLDELPKRGELAMPRGPRPVPTAGEPGAEADEAGDEAAPPEPEEPADA